MSQNYLRDTEKDTQLVVIIINNNYYQLIESLPSKGFETIEINRNKQKNRKLS